MVAINHLISSLFGSFNYNVFMRYYLNSHFSDHDNNFVINLNAFRGRCQTPQNKPISIRIATIWENRHGHRPLIRTHLFVVGHGTSVHTKTENCMQPLIAHIIICSHNYNNNKALTRDLNSESESICSLHFCLWFVVVALLFSIHNNNNIYCNFNLKI